jgi:hypothetical protein
LQPHDRVRPSKVCSAEKKKDSKSSRRPLSRTLGGTLDLDPLGLPTVYITVRFREYRKFLAGAFFVSSGMQFYFCLAKISIPLLWTNATQSPKLSGIRGAIHFCTLADLYIFRLVFPRKSSEGWARELWGMYGKSDNIHFFNKIREVFGSHNLHHFKI